MNKSKIGWCDSTWNPVTGCFHDCEYCYARGIAERFRGKGELRELDTGFWLDRDTFEVLKGSGVYETKYPLTTGEKPEPFEPYNGKVTPYPFGFSPTFHRYRLNDYIGKQGRNIFVCSMADLFGKWVPDSWIEEIFKACAKAPQHNYLFLTKNPARYVELINNTDFFVKTKSNMWFGYSYTGKECKQWWNPDYNIFASVEPILEPIEVPRCKWLIVGAETGRRKDKVVPERKWIEDIVNECRKANIPIFMKSSLADIWGEPLIQEYPDELRKRG